MENEARKKAIRAWTMYDWTHSTFETTIETACFTI